MDKFMEKLKDFWKIIVGYWQIFLVYWKKFVVFCKNKWTKFTVASIIYILLFVVWPGNLWFLLGLPFIYDRYISRLFYRYVGSKNEALRKKSKIYNSIYGWFDAIKGKDDFAGVAGLRGHSKTEIIGETFEGEFVGVPSLSMIQPSGVSFSALL